MRSSLRPFIALALTVAVLAYPATVLASEGEGTSAEGAMAGQVDGKANTNGVLWLGAGCLFEVLGLAAAYLYTPNPPAMRLLGKSPEYVAAYMDAYGDGARSVQTSNAWLGCIASTLLGAGFYVLAAIAASSSY